MSTPNHQPNIMKKYTEEEMRKYAQGIASSRMEEIAERLEKISTNLRLMMNVIAGQVDDNFKGIIEEMKK